MDFCILQGKSRVCRKLFPYKKNTVEFGKWLHQLQLLESYRLSTTWVIMELSRGRCSCTELILFVKVPGKDTILLRSGITTTCKELHHFGQGKFVSRIVFMQRDFFLLGLSAVVSLHTLIRLDWFKL